MVLRNKIDNKSCDRSKDFSKNVHILRKIYRVIYMTLLEWCYYYKRLIFSDMYQIN